MLYNMFPGDEEEELVIYQYSLPDENSPAFTDHNGFAKPYKHTTVANPYNEFNINFMERLNRTFMEQINRERQGRLVKAGDLIEFIELIYTELIYTSYINNASPIDIDEAYITMLMDARQMDIPPLKPLPRRGRRPLGKIDRRGRGARGQRSRAQQEERGRSMGRRRKALAGLEQMSRKQLQAWAREQKGFVGQGGRKRRKTRKKRKKKHKRKTRKKR